jgi:YD repeat-containing protein
MEEFFIEDNGEELISKLTSGGKIKSISYYSGDLSRSLSYIFDTNKNLIEQNYSDNVRYETGSGYRWRYTYDASNRLIKKSDYRFSGSRDYIYNQDYRYNIDGLLEQIYQPETLESPSKITKFQFSRFGELSFRRELSEESSDIFVYDHLNRCIERISYKDSSADKKRIHKRVVYSYEGYNSLFMFPIEEIEFDGSNQIKHRKVFEYNEKTSLLEKIIETDGKIGSANFGEIIFEYLKFDTHNNWTERVKNFANGRTIDVTRRSIEYHPHP